MTEKALTPETIQNLFTRKDGTYKFARWGRPIAPVVFGVDDETLTHLKTTITQTVAITGSTIVETDPELSANFMWFFCKDWDEIAHVPDLEKLVPNLHSILDDLTANNLNEYRMFIFDADGAIKMCLLFLRMQDAVADLSISVLATGETLQSLLLWPESAFEQVSPIAVIQSNGICIVKPKYASLVRAAYDPVLPNSATDATQHSMRLFPRAQKLYSELEQ